MEMLKAGGDAFADWVFEILEKIWKTQIVPVEQNTALLVPVYDKKDKRIYDNYRGIASTEYTREGSFSDIARLP